MRSTPLWRVLALCIIIPGLAGCGVTKLWGKDAQTASSEALSGPTLREQAASLANPVWDIENKRSLMSQMAGVLVNGARSAGQALDVFDWSDDESPEFRQASKYLEQVGERKGSVSFLDTVMKDVESKTNSARAFSIAGTQALDYYHGTLADLAKSPEASTKRDTRKSLLKDADEGRRAAIQASKSLRQQASVFAATAEILKTSDDKPDVTQLVSEISELLLKADELRALADELDLD